MKSIGSIAVVALYLISSVEAIYGPPPLNKKDVTSVLGVNTHNLNPSTHDLDLIQEAGIRWVRDDVGWQQVEKVKGEYDFSDVDYMFKSLAERNIGWICILGAYNPNYNNATDKPLISTQTQIDAWAKFAGAIAAKYSKTNIVLFELTNEPNGMGGFKGDEGAAIYAKLSIAGAKQIHDNGGTVAVSLSTALHPVSIIPLSLTLTQRSSIPCTPQGPAVANLDYDWLDSIFLNGFLTSVDYLTLHPYRSITPETVMLDYDKVSKLVNEYNPPNHKIQITQGECGYEYHGVATPNLDHELQGKFVVRMYLSAIGKQVFPAIWYDWKAGNISDPQQEHDGMVDEELNPLPGWYGTKILHNILRGTEFINMPMATVSYPSLPSPQDYAVALKNSTHSIIVAWSALSYEHNIQLHDANGCWNATDWLGKVKQSICNKKGENYLNVIVTDAPLYLTQEQ